MTTGVFGSDIPFIKESRFEVALTASSTSGIEEALDKVCQAPRIQSRHRYWTWYQLSRVLVMTVLIFASCAPRKWPGMQLCSDGGRGDLGRFYRVGRDGHRSSWTATGGSEKESKRLDVMMPYLRCRSKLYGYRSDSGAQFLRTHTQRSTTLMDLHDHRLAATHHHLLA